MEYNREYFVKKGREGVKIKHARKYELVVELAKYVYGKDEQNKLMEMTVSELEFILKRFVNRKV